MFWDRSSTVNMIKMPIQILISKALPYPNHRTYNLLGGGITKGKRLFKGNKNLNISAIDFWLRVNRIFLLSGRKEFRLSGNEFFSAVLVFGFVTHHRFFSRPIPNFELGAFDGLFETVREVLMS